MSLSLRNVAGGRRGWAFSRPRPRLGSPSDPAPARDPAQPEPVEGPSTSLGRAGRGAMLTLCRVTLTRSGRCAGRRHRPCGGRAGGRWRSTRCRTLRPRQGGMGAGMGGGGEAVAGEVAQGFGEDALVGGIRRRFADAAAQAGTGRGVVVGGAERHRGAERTHEYGTGAIPGGGKADCHGGRAPRFLETLRGGVPEALYRRKPLSLGESLWLLKPCRRSLENP